MLFEVFLRKKSSASVFLHLIVLHDGHVSISNHGRLEAPMWEVLQWYDVPTNFHENQSEHIDNIDVCMQDLTFSWW
jgi:hypothetical protein